MPSPSETPPWETVADRTTLPLDALEFLFDSASTPASDGLAAYARAAFPPGRPLLEAVLDLTRRIHEEFTFDPTATTVKTPLADVFRLRRGVCQDFARLEIACLRSLGLPARYISGYLETAPPPGRAAAASAPTRRTPGWRSTVPRSAGFTSIPPTTCCRRSGTSPWPGGATTATSARSTA